MSTARPGDWSRPHTPGESTTQGPGEPATDEQRFRALFDVHYTQIARYFVSRGCTAADADDLVAATFEVAWRQLDAVPRGEEAILWLYGVARNHLRNARRKAQREAAFLDDFRHAVPPVAELPVQSRADAAKTMRALARLKPPDRELVLLVAWDELTPSEAGRVLGLRPSAARSRLHRARRRLAELLDPATDGPPAQSSRARSAREQDPAAPRR